MNSLPVLNCQGISQSGPREDGEDRTLLRLGHLSRHATYRKTRTAAATATAGEAIGRDAGLSNFAAAIGNAVVSRLLG